MPELIFTGPTSHHYPVTRDANGILLSDVEPGDIRDLDEAPDLMWREPGDEDQSRIAAEPSAQDGPENEAEDSAETTETAASEPGDKPAAVTSGPVPAPPAVLPSA